MAEPKIVPSKTESPTRHFEKPRDVVTDSSLTRHEKEKVLGRWQEDAEELQRAEDEGMAGGEASQLIEVVDAKKAIDPKRKAAE